MPFQRTDMQEHKHLRAGDGPKRGQTCLCLVIAFALISCKQISKGRGHEFERDIVVNGPNELKVEKPRRLEKQIEVTGPNDIKLELVYIESGTFTMGTDTRLTRLLSIINFEFESDLDEGPPRKVTITKGFYIGKYKVTVGQYCEFLNSPDVNDATRFLSFNRRSRIIRRNGQFVPRQPGVEECAVNTVHWEGANSFCEWLSRRTGRCFRLPTEAEWEFTLRGPEGRFYPWGDEEPKRSNKAKDTNEVKFSEPWMGPSVYSIAERSPANVTPDGAVGMFGHAGEWVQDYYATRYPNKEEIDPTGPKKPPILIPGYDNTPYRVLRRPRFAPTEREFGLKADYGGGYCFRVLMEIDKNLNIQAEPK